MYKRLGRGLSRISRAGQYAIVIGWSLLIPARRALLRRMVAFSSSLPGRFSQPLPEMMAVLTPAFAPVASALSEHDIRRLADAVAAWHVRSSLGLCLRRSLLRYYFLREMGLPVQIVFGVRLKTEVEGGGVGGHAWLTLHGMPYHEAPADYAGFTEIYRYPP